MIRIAIVSVLLMFTSTTRMLADDASGPVGAAYTAWDTAFNKGDAAGVSDFYTEDALFLAPDHQVRRGRESIRSFFKGLFDAGVKNHELTLIEAGGTRETIYATASWKAQGTTEGGKPSEVGGIATHIFVPQDDGSLKLKLHIFN